LVVQSLRELAFKGERSSSARGGCARIRPQLPQATGGQRFGADLLEVLLRLVPTVPRSANPVIGNPEWCDVVEGRALRHVVCVRNALCFSSDGPGTRVVEQGVGATSRKATAWSVMQINMAMFAKFGTLDPRKHNRATSAGRLALATRCYGSRSGTRDKLGGANREWHD
jgi:hypothetical protein